MKVLIAVDESRASKAVFERVSSRVWSPDTVLRLITVYTGDPVARFREQTTTTARHFIVELSSALHAVSKDALVDCDVLEGNPAAAIVDAAKAWKADLIIVGANDKNAIQRTFLGSVSQAVLEHAPCPVLIVRDAGANNHSDYMNIVVALEGSQESELALDWFYSRPWRTDAHFHFLSIMDGLPKEYGRHDLPVEEAMVLLEQHEKLKEEKLEHFTRGLLAYAPFLSEWRYTVEVDDGEPGQKIVAAVERHNADLVVLGSHGLSGLTKMLLGSVSTYVACHSPSAVLIIRPLNYEEGQSSSNLGPCRLDDEPPDHIPHLGHIG